LFTSYAKKVKYLHCTRYNCFVLISTKSNGKEHASIVNNKEHGP